MQLVEKRHVASITVYITCTSVVKEIDELGEAVEKVLISSRLIDI